MKQQELKALLQEVLSQCKKENIQISDYILPDIVINSRAKSRFGACRKIPMNKLQSIDLKHIIINKKVNCFFQIELCEAMMNANEQEIKNVIAHEVLHTCPGCYNHGKLWKTYASKLNNIYGYNITSTTTYEKIGIQKPEKKEAYRYKITCQRCGKEFYRMKKSKLVTETNRYRCGCGGKLKCIDLE